MARFSTWIYTIARNLANSELRKRKRRKTFSISELSKNKRKYDMPDDKKDVESK